MTYNKFIAEYRKVSAMNKTILAEFAKAKNIYPLVLGTLMKHDNRPYFLENWIPNNLLLDELKKITGKHITVIDSCFKSMDFICYIEDFEDLSFIISLPEPKIIKNITQEEMAVIAEIVKDEDYRKYTTDNIVYGFFTHFNNYFEKLLEINLQYLMQNYN